MCMDYYSGFTYYYPQTSTNPEETLKTKAAFEAYYHSLGVAIRHYHCDNGRFANKGFMAAMKDKTQTISCDEVNSHW